MKPTDIIHESWSPLLGELYQEQLLKLNTEVLPNCISYPQKENIFRVFRMPLSAIKVVIIGQDPYFIPDLANGLAFAVNENTKVPASLRNIRKELIDSEMISLHSAHAGNWQTLEHWEEQGVFLLNTALTVESGKPGSHLLYWGNFIKKVVFFIAKNNHPVWLLWGRKAQSFELNMPSKEIYRVKGYTKETIAEIPINPHWNYVLKGSHPAAESYSSNAGFFGCNHFYHVNKILDLKGQKQIHW